MSSIHEGVGEGARTLPREERLETVELLQESSLEPRQDDLSLQHPLDHSVNQILEDLQADDTLSREE